MKILIATDGSECSYQAFRAAIALLPLDAAEVFVAAVTPISALTIDVATAYHAADRTFDDKLYATASVETRQHLHQALELLEAKGIKATKVELRGDPAEELLKLAHRLAPDLVVLGAHGRGPVERLFMGSVSDAVLHQWEGATLVVRGVKSPEVV